MKNSNYYIPFVKKIYKIFNYDCLMLDINIRRGNTGYIDFIKPDELTDLDIMKGTDMYERQFIVFKSELTCNETKIRSFTTFFQRYKNSETLYHTAGHYGGPCLFITEGGATLEQIEYLDKLLETGEIELGYEDANKFRINYNNTYNSDEEKKNFKYKIKLGWT
jgi:hypothetical protein